MTCWHYRTRPHALKVPSHRPPAMSLPHETVKELIVHSEPVLPRHGSTGESSGDSAANVLEVEGRKPLGSSKAFAGYLVLSFAVWCTLRSSVTKNPKKELPSTAADKVLTDLAAPDWSDALHALFLFARGHPDGGECCWPCAWHKRSLRCHWPHRVCGSLRVSRGGLPDIPVSSACRSDRTALE